MRKQKGFSLIELLIVVAIILIIAAIAIPNLLKAKMSANESSAASQMRSWTTAEVSYLNACGGYANTAAALGPATPETCATGMGYVDSSVSGLTLKSGYNFAYHATGTAAKGSDGSTNVNPSYEYFGGPLGWKSTGTNGFCTTQDNIIRKINGATVQPADPATDTACQGNNPVS